MIQREGQGFLEIEEGQKILHVKGSSYEMGYQHGKLLRNDILVNISNFINQSQANPNLRIENFFQNYEKRLCHTPSSFIDEIKGISDGSETPFNKILLLNLFPEMFHCSAISLRGKASHDESLYHVRVLDYAIQKSL